jgi:UV excision repair protein RAD23
MVQGIPEGMGAQEPPAAGGEAAAPAPAQPAAGGAAAAPAAAGGEQPAVAAAPAAPAGVPQNLFQVPLSAPRTAHTLTSLAQLAQQQQQQAQAANPLAGGRVNLQALANSGQLGQLRTLVQNNPQMLQPLIQQLAAQDPQLAAAVTANPELLFQILGGQADAEGDDAMEGDAQGGIPPGAHVIELTQNERAAVERVSAACRVPRDDR